MNYFLVTRKDKKITLTKKEFNEIQNILLSKDIPKFIKIGNTLVNSFDISILEEDNKPKPPEPPDFKNFKF